MAIHKTNSLDQGGVKIKNKTSIILTLIFAATLITLAYTYEKTKMVSEIRKNEIKLNLKSDNPDDNVFNSNYKEEQKGF